MKSDDPSFDPSRHDSRGGVSRGGHVEGSASQEVAFEEWVSAHYEVVYRYAFRLAGQQASAEDLCQTTFLQAWRASGQVRDAERVRSWLMTICRNAFLKQLRRTDPTAFSQWEVDPQETVEDERAERVAERVDVQDVLNRLPSEARVVLLMFFFEGLSYKEIAESLGVKMGTVMSRLARAKTRLRESLEGEVSPSDLPDSGSGSENA